ncbi:MAG TPA: hypothetical protein VGN24_04035 [Rhodanobacter sp.]|jgi:hypothetical protein|nr:hypothetical protein [Rhodanobacter sp.]
MAMSPGGLIGLIGLIGKIRVELNTEKHMKTRVIHSIRKLFHATLPMVLMLAAFSARADYFVFKLTASPPNADDVPTSIITTKDAHGNTVTFDMVWDTGDGLGDGGFYLSPDTAKSLGIHPDAGTPGNVVGAGGTSTMRQKVTPPSIMTFKDQPTVAAAQAKKAPTLPAMIEVGSSPFSAIVGSSFLSAYQYGRTSGTQGSYFWLSEKTEGADAQRSAVALSIDSASAKPVQKAPDGRPKGTKSTPIMPHTNAAPSGALAFDGGGNIGIYLTGVPQPLNDVPFLLKSGLPTTLISSATAAALGITDLATLSTMVVKSDFGDLEVRSADLTLGLFEDDPNFLFSNVMVGIIDPGLDSSNPFGQDGSNFFQENFLGSDVLDQLAYWEVDGPPFSASNPTDGTFYAARYLTAAVDEPASIGLFCFGVTAILLFRWRSTKT